MLTALFCFIAGVLAAPLGGLLQLSVLALFSGVLADHQSLTAAQRHWRSTWLRLMAIGFSLGLFYVAMLIADNVPIPLVDFASGAAGIALAFLLFRWLIRQQENSPMASTSADALGSASFIHLSSHAGTHDGYSDCTADSGSSCDGGGGDGGGGGGD
ncbi:hypothetical protein [Phytopseudomonas dryadis]|uniref:Uncharacterized protein n=1 Tax=Phytopseudomonas dryadis TaxID=2487520 RepID=A0A4Q9RAC2_9GAMM|nr:MULTISPECIES: hypothetical protein [Pseudomonas]TBU97140.1 hypothetical protein DNK44_02825 [Pseudomonas dryadis]TBV08518.1 hypothetical protein DNK34_04435 [Pseudomonas dryadis]TBV18887.1 hypothetical protein DNK41_05860 [Pseudomonas sp. FRB 230]